MRLLLGLSLIFVAASFGSARNINAIENNPLPEKRFILVEDDDNKLHIIDLQQPVVRVDVPEEEVTFHFTSRNTYSLQLNVDDFEEIKNTDFDVNRRTMFIVHGWNNHKDSHVNQYITNALLEAEDWNIIVVDWKKKANSMYHIALGAVPGVGDIAAKFIERLISITGIKIDKIHLAGHSLGAHVCGRIGSNFNGQIPVIVGMDPALPFISETDPDKRVDPTDAQHVQIIHTNGGLLGFLVPIGDSDFYPNGGMNQKGCGIDVIGTCAHSRSYKYFAESITNHNFVAISCASRQDWDTGNCNNNAVGRMGGNNLDTSLSGSYYLTTNTAEPFALG